MSYYHDIPIHRGKGRKYVNDVYMLRLDVGHDFVSFKCYKKCRSSNIFVSCRLEKCHDNCVTHA